MQLHTFRRPAERINIKWWVLGIDFAMSHSRLWRLFWTPCCRFSVHTWATEEKKHTCRILLAYNYPTDKEWVVRALDLSHPTTPEVTPPNGTPVKKSHPTITGSHPKQVGPPWYTSFIYPWNMHTEFKDFPRFSRPKKEYSIFDCKNLNI